MNQLIYAVFSAEEAKLVTIILEETAKAELSAINQRVFDQNRPPAHTCAGVLQDINDTILDIRAGVPLRIKVCVPNFKFERIEFNYFNVEQMIKDICEDLQPNESALIFYKETYQLVNSFAGFLAQNPKTTRNYSFERKYRKS